MNEKEFESIVARLRSNDQELSTLDLSNQVLNVENLQNLAIALRTNSVLNFLNLENCEINDTRLTILVGALKDNQTLKILILRSNLISGVDNVLSDILSSNNSLIFLDLGNNLIHKTKSSIASGLKKNQSLIFLALDKNQINYRGFNYLIKSISPESNPASKLAGLFLDNNRISDSEIITFNQGGLQNNLGVRIYFEDEGFRVLALRESVDFLKGHFTDKKGLWFGPGSYQDLENYSISQSPKESKSGGLNFSMEIQNNSFLRDEMSFSEVTDLRSRTSVTNSYSSSYPGVVNSNFSVEDSIVSSRQTSSFISGSVGIFDAKTWIDKDDPAHDGLKIDKKSENLTILLKNIADENLVNLSRLISKDHTIITSVKINDLSSDDNLARLLKILKDNKQNKLKSFELTNVELKRISVEALNDLFNQNDDLKKIDLSGCKFEKNSLPVLIKILKNKNNIETLNLSSIGIDEEMMEILVINLSKSLLDLDISNNQVTDRVIETLLETLKGGSLANLNLKLCQLTDNSLGFLLNNFNDLANLRSLEIKGCKFTEKSIDYLRLDEEDSSILRLFKRRILSDLKDSLKSYGDLEARSTILAVESSLLISIGDLVEEVKDRNLKGSKLKERITAIRAPRSEPGFIIEKAIIYLRQSREAIESSSLVKSDQEVCDSDIESLTFVNLSLDLVAGNQIPKKAKQIADAKIMDSSELLSDNSEKLYEALLSSEIRSDDSTVTVDELRKLVTSFDEVEKLIISLRATDIADGEQKYYHSGSAVRIISDLESKIIKTLGLIFKESSFKAESTPSSPLVDIVRKSTTSQSSASFTYDLSFQSDDYECQLGLEKKPGSSPSNLGYCVLDNTPSSDRSKF